MSTTFTPYTAYAELKTTIRFVPNVSAFRPDLTFFIYATSSNVTGNYALKKSCVSFKPTNNYGVSTNIISYENRGVTPNGIDFKNVTLRGLKSTSMVAYIHETFICDYEIAIYDSKGNRWRIGSPDAPFNTPFKINVHIPTLFTKYGPDNKIKLTSTIKDAGYDVRFYEMAEDAVEYVFQIYPDVEEPDENLYSSVLFDNIIDDDSHKSDWLTNYNATPVKPWWVNSDRWVLNWENYAGVGLYNNNKPRYPDMDLIWVLTDDDEPSLSVTDLNTYRSQIPSGKRSYLDWIKNGGTYNGGIGKTEKDGYVELNLNDIYVKRGYYIAPKYDPVSGELISGFTGKGYLHLAMAVVNTNNDVVFSTPVKSYPVRYEPVKMGLGPQIQLATCDANNRVQISIADAFDGKTPVSPVKTAYAWYVNNGGIWSLYEADTTKWPTHDGILTQLSISNNQNNVAFMANSDVKMAVLMKYMNNTGVDVSAIASTDVVQLFPKCQKPYIDVRPEIVDGELFYVLSIAVDDSNNEYRDADEYFKYAFFREDVANVDYTVGAINSKTVPSAHHSGSDSDYFQNSMVFYTERISEQDIEQHDWVAAIESTFSNKRDWYKLSIGTSSINGSLETSVNTGGDVKVALSKEASNRYVKDITINSISTGVTQFKETVTASRTYTVGKPLQSVMLEVDDYIPSSFPKTAESYIQYYLVLNNTRYPITPKNRTGSSPYIYYINTKVSDDIISYRHSLKEEFITTVNAYKEFKIEAVMNYEPEQKYLTPMIFSWRVMAITGQNDLLSAGAGGI
ncbi:hypothetical protein [Acinetobacter sp.]|uniref:hypothetical protein n=1 Tax=Acinetobacter sp. TaxID=472 RepID=UPI003D0504E2